MYTSSVSAPARPAGQANGVYEELRELIVRGRLAPGARLVELDITERLGVSRTPAREAIQRLAADGFLRQIGLGSRSRFVVAPLTDEDCADLYRTMGALEGAAARHIAGLSTAGRKPLAGELRGLESRIEETASRPRLDLDRIFEAHNAFHSKLVAAAASPRLSALILLTRPHVERYEFLYAPVVGGDYRETFDEHLQIIRVVREGSASDLERAVRANWMNGGERLRNAMRRIGPRGDW